MTTNLSIPYFAPARVNPVLAHPSERRLTLGDWRFRLDPMDIGAAEGWYNATDDIVDPIAVPGCWQGQGYGHDGLDELWDFHLKARTFRATYTGTGWYATTFRVPEDWTGARCLLNLGGAHPSAELWLNGVPLGAHDLPFVPFGFDITTLVQPNATHDLAVRIHERHREFAFAFNWQGNWSGLYRPVELTAVGAARLAHVALNPDLDSGALCVSAHIGGFSAPLTLRVTVDEQDIIVPVTAPGASTTLSLPDVRSWSPDAPNLYRVDVELLDGETVLDAMRERTGFVKLETVGKHFLINGAPCYLRGTGDFISSPETGSPDTDRDRWRKKLRTLRDFGYNYVRTQSYVYTPEYFDVADEVGLLVQSEMGMLGAWGGTNPMHVYQWPKPTPDNYPTLKQQWDLTVARDVNHPSANLYCMSNEYAGSTDFPRIAWQCYRDTKAMKPTAFIIWTDGGYRAELPGDFVNAEAGVDAECAKPVIQHEFRWWSAFPDVRRKHKYDGAVRPYAMEIAWAAAATYGLAHLLPAFADASLRLQFLEAKAKMEACRRDHPTLAGICHFDAMDANPSPQGIIDEFYDEKITSAACWRETNGDTVILAHLNFDDRCLRGGDDFHCALAVSDFAHPPFANPVITWALTDGEKTIAEGRHDYAHEPYRTCAAGDIACALPRVTAPRALTLHVVLASGTRTVTNAWNLWLFPAANPLPTGVVRYGGAQASWLKEWTDIPVAEPEELPQTRVVLAEHLDELLLGFIYGGGRVILAASEGLVRPHPPNFGYVKYFFTPPANYSPYEDGQNGTLLQEHPMLGALPHDGFADLHFFRMIDDAPPLDLGPLDLAEGDPVLRVIHRYPVCRPLGYLVERACGLGALLLCGLSLNPAHVEAQYLLQQLCAYAAGDDFRPECHLSDTAVERIMTGTALTEFTFEHNTS